jgi:copper chaperone CopZ
MEDYDFEIIGMHCDNCDETIMSGDIYFIMDYDNMICGNCSPDGQW